MIYSASSIWASYKFGNQFKYVLHQLLFFIIGLFLIYLINKIDIGFYYKNASKIFVVCLILLILVLIIYFTRPKYMNYKKQIYELDFIKRKNVYS